MAKRDRREYQKEWINNNRDKVNQSKRRYYKKNRVEIAKYQRLHKQKIHHRWSNMKRKEHCHICGMSFVDSPEICNYHHLDRDKKRYGNSMKNLSKTNQDLEKAKCITLCANCHSIVHFGNGIGLLGRNNCHKTLGLEA